MKFVKNLSLLLTLILFVASCSDSDKFVFTHKVMVNDGIDFVSVGNDGRSVELAINSQEDCSILADADWFTVDQTKIKNGKSTLTLTLSENKGAPRHDDITFQSEGFTQTLVVQQNAANTTYEDATHNIYATFGTMPSLYLGLHMLLDEKPCLFFYHRTQTFDATQFPAHVTSLTFEGSSNPILDASVEMKKQILEINRKDPDAIFAFYVDDFRSSLGYNWFVGQGIDSSRVKVTLLTDGAGSYNEFYKAFGDAATGEANWGKYENQVKDLSWDNHNIFHTKDSDNAYNYQLPYAMSTLDNYRYVLQAADLLETNSTFVQGKLENEMHTVDYPPVNMLKQLTPAQLDQFHRMTKFDSKTIKAMFDENDRDNLIIISTNPSSSIMPQVLKTIDTYSKQYDMFMSVHPADPDVDKLKELEAQGKVKIFPQGLPFEVLLWTFMDDIQAMGGSQSTVFITAPVEKVKFMYADSAEGMVKPLDKMFKGQEGINWMGK